LSYRWLLNEFPVFIALDKRRFVSQTDGNLYIANVEASDKGNYSCFVSSPSITKSVFSKFIPLIPQSDRAKVYPADIKVKFKDTPALLGQNVTLECFALGK
ncbi:CNTN1 protein, partial [Quiscalus mexicanus]|nr:CNTN1 protein [Quiscalus mexicanus]